MTQRVLAVVVTYNPQAEALAVVLRACAAQVDAVLVVDNASDNVADVERECASVESNNVQLLKQQQNLGLGAAHNVGINQARQNSFDYVLLLDQDSVPMSSMVQTLLQAHQRKSQLGQVSATGVVYLNADNGQESFFVRFGWLKFQRQYCADRDEDGCIEADFLISSGSLISLQAIAQVGDMDEQLFIDHVDTEWFLRARDKGLKAYGVCDAVMQHGLGETTHQINLRGTSGRQRNVPQHKPFRYYYIFRNSVLLYKRRYTSGIWKWNDLQRLGMIALMFGVLKSPRRANAKMMLHGFADGILGKTGKLRN